jgi:tRNA-specific 2-thiouridylase
MSGGVDSSVAAAMLLEEGFDVVGLFMKNWAETDENGCCTAESDFSDVAEVAGLLGIRHYTIDFSKEYLDKVFKLFLSEYKKGRTPNPDVLCNREIKFGRFLDFAKDLGADFIATGHYCNLDRRGNINYLTRARDEDKDQTYFLNQLENRQLDNVLFPVGDMIKSEVRAYAKAKGLPTAAKKDSTGICFIGERDFRRFLASYIPMKAGDMVDLSGKVVGRHNGVFYYTEGQRHGLGLGGPGEPWFVVRKDVEKNILTVSRGECAELFSSGLITEGFNFISGAPESSEFKCMARIRHRQPLQSATAFIEGDGVRVVFDKSQRAVSPGQYCVLYSDRVCLGGGVIAEALR